MATTKAANHSQAMKEIMDSLETNVTSPLQQEDRKALALKLTGEIKQDFGNAIRKLRRMHAEQLWQELGYTSFKDYVLLEFGKTPKWGYQQLTWLRAEECLEARGVTDPLRSLSPEAALVYRRWENCPDVFYLAYQQIIERGEQPTQKRLEEECEVQNDFLQEASQTPDLSQEEYRAYLKLRTLPYTYQLDKDFQSANDLLEACRSLKRRPPLKAITQVARGADLIAFVERLEPLSADVAKLAELKSQKAELEKQKRDQSKRLVEQIRQVEEQIGQMEQHHQDEEDEDDDGDQGETGDATAQSQEKSVPDWFKDDLSLEVEDDPRKKAEQDGTPFDPSDLAAIAADCLADACMRNLGDAASVLGRATKAREWADKLIEMCQKQDAAVEPPSVESVEA